MSAAIERYLSFLGKVCELYIYNIVHDKPAREATSYQISVLIHFAFREDTNRIK